MVRSRVHVDLLQTESVSKVTGTIDYVSNFELPGMLHGRIVRSTVPHALIESISTADAVAAPGVVAVLTGRDLLTVMPEPFYGPAFYDQPVLAQDRVRYVGEPIAVVLGETYAAASDAVDLVEVEYRELEAVYDEVEAASDSAPRVHERLRPGDAFADLRHLGDVSDTNIGLESTVIRGDAETALRAAHRVFEHEYKTQQTAQVPMESHVAVADCSEPHRVTVHSTTQSPSFVRQELARLLRWPESRVRVRSGFLGGGFGAKLYVKLEPLAVASSLIMQRPVRIAITMDEQFFLISRHATTTRIRTGVDENGLIQARTVDIWWNGGAYADIGPRVTQKSGFISAGPYDIPNVTLRSRSVYTNRTPAGAMRGFGIPQMTFAFESHTDEIARALGRDPAEFRRANLLDAGQTHPTGTVLEDVAVGEVLDQLQKRLAERALAGDVGPLRRGRGFAISLKAVVAPTTSVARVTMSADGSVAVHQNTIDVGQGSTTVMAQIAAEVLSVDPTLVTVLKPDTDSNPYDMGTLGSRSTFHMGNAVRMAAEQVRERLTEMAVRVTGIPADQLVFEDGTVGGLSYQEVIIHEFGAHAGSLVGAGTFTPAYEKPDRRTGQSSKITAFWMVGGSGVDITVDIETGKITVDRIVTVGDVGRALNPQMVRRQLTGGAVMQLGQTMTEEMRYDGGQLTNTGLAFYKVPTILDVPVANEAVIVEAEHRNGPFGAKGVGETGTFALSPAIANAVHDAVGVRIRQLPITGERVLAALRERQD